MRAAAKVRGCCNVCFLLRGLGALALAREDQNFARSDEQRCNKSDPLVAFHKCLREMSSVAIECVNSIDGP